MPSGYVITPFWTERASYVGFDPKKKQAPDFYVGFRKRVPVTIRDLYPLRKVDKYIDVLGDTQVVSTLDANNGCWKMELAKTD